MGVTPWRFESSHPHCLMTEPPARRTPASRLLGAGARSAERVAALTGVDQALEDALEEAIVRALRSPAVERAVVRVIQQNAVQDAVARTLTSEEVADAIIKALDTEVADKVWADILASQQGADARRADRGGAGGTGGDHPAGRGPDHGRRPAADLLTETLDDAFEHVVHRLLRRGGASETETNEAGLLTRMLAAGGRPRPAQRRLLARLRAAGVRSCPSPSGGQEPAAVGDRHDRGARLPARRRHPRRVLGAGRARRRGCAS